MSLPSPNILLALFILSFSLSAIFHRSQSHSSSPTSPSIFRYAADILVPNTNDTFSSRPAAFGAGFDDVVEGDLVKAWGNGLACSDVSEEEQKEETGREGYKGKIVLVQRGQCSFAEKVRWVQQVGGIAVIVGDNTPGAGLLTMYAKGTHPSTPA